MYYILYYFRCSSLDPYVLWPITGSTMGALWGSCLLRFPSPPVLHSLSPAVWLCGYPGLLLLAIVGAIHPVNKSSGARNTKKLCNENNLFCCRTWHFIAGFHWWLYILSLSASQIWHPHSDRQPLFLCSSMFNDTHFTVVFFPIYFAIAKFKCQFWFHSFIT